MAEKDSKATAGTEAPKPSSLMMLPPETGIAEDQGGAVEVGTKSVTHDDRSMETEAGTGRVKVEGVDADLTDEEREALGDSETEEGAEEGEDTAEEALPDYDQENEEVVGAYEDRYRPNGTFNMDALSQEWAKNAAGDVSKGSLNENTYKYLESIGVSRDMAKSIEAGEVLKAQQAETRIIDAAGGQEALSSALAWARKGGYDEKGRERYNSIMKGSDLQAKEDAVSALMSRFQKANPPGRRAVRPRRSTAEGGSAPRGPAGYDSYTTYQTKLREARNANGGRGDPAMLAEVRAKYKASDRTKWTDASTSRR